MTRLGLSALSMQRYGSFAGKKQAPVRIVLRLRSLIARRERAMSSAAAQLELGSQVARTQRSVATVAKSGRAASQVTRRARGDG